MKQKFKLGRQDKKDVTGRRGRNQEAQTFKENM
jgi:hypothetical protein